MGHRKFGEEENGIWDNLNRFGPGYRVHTCNYRKVIYFWKIELTDVGYYFEAKHLWHIGYSDPPCAWGLKIEAFQVVLMRPILLILMNCSDCLITVVQLLRLLFFYMTKIWPHSLFRWGLVMSLAEDTSWLFLSLEPSLPLENWISLHQSFQIFSLCPMLSLTMQCLQHRLASHQDGDPLSSTITCGCPW